MNTNEERPWLYAKHKDNEDWSWGGPTMEDAVAGGCSDWGADSDDEYDEPLSGFWVAPAHKSRAEHPDDCDPEEHEYTVESDKAQWIPFT
jgi:hypothetical protein